MYVLIVKFKAAEGSENELISILRGVLAKIRQNEKDTAMYDVHQKIGDPTEIMLYERYPDKKAWEEGHWAQPYITEMRAALAKNLSAPPEMTEYDVVEVR